MGGRFLLRIAIGSTVWSRALSLDEGQALEGGRESGRLRLNHESVSRRHFRLSREGGQLWITDLESRGGIFLNGRQVKGREAVALGDLLVVGPFQITLMAPEAVAAAVPAAPAAPTVPVPFLWGGWLSPRGFARFLRWVWFRPVQVWTDLPAEPSSAQVLAGGMKFALLAMLLHGLAPLVRYFWVPGAPLPGRTLDALLVRSLESGVLGAMAVCALFIVGRGLFLPLMGTRTTWSRMGLFALCLGSLGLPLGAWVAFGGARALPGITALGAGLFFVYGCLAFRAYFRPRLGRFMVVQAVLVAVALSAAASHRQAARKASLESARTVSLESGRAVKPLL